MLRGWVPEFYGIFALGYHLFDEETLIGSGVAYSAIRIFASK